MIQSAPPVGQFGAPSFPGFQINGGPDYVEDREKYISHVFDRLIPADDADLRKLNSNKEKYIYIYIIIIFFFLKIYIEMGIYNFSFYPIYGTHCSWNNQGGGVMAEPREVHGNLDSEIFTNIVQGLGTKKRADPRPL